MATSPRVVSAIVSVALLVTFSQRMQSQGRDEPVASAGESSRHLGWRTLRIPPRLRSLISTPASTQPYTDMSVEAFEALPRDERLLYTQHPIHWTASREGLPLLALLCRHESAPGHQYQIKPVVASRENNGQEIVDACGTFCKTMARNLQCSWAATFRTQEPRAKTSANPRNNVPDAQKVLSSAYYIVGEGIVSNVLSGDEELARHANG